MRGELTLRLYAVFFLLTFVWVLLGAPLLPTEWQDIPARLRLMLAQLAGRMSTILLFWP